MGIEIGVPDGTGLFYFLLFCPTFRAAFKKINKLETGLRLTLETGVYETASIKKYFPSHRC